jgi:6,7-dimethyl-8-ribityllumazine synthase
MKENEQASPLGSGVGVHVIALGDVSVARKEITMTHTRYAFIKANWHADIVGQSLVGFLQIIPAQQVDVFNVPGAFELPLVARDLAKSGRYAAVAAAALVVDGGIYRHDFVAQAVVNGLMHVALDTDVPILSVSLTPHHFQPTEHHVGIFVRHFVDKGREAAQAALMIGNTREALAAWEGHFLGYGSKGDCYHAVNSFASGAEAGLICFLTLA